jgi:hypothetical protein
VSDAQILSPGARHFVDLCAEFCVSPRSLRGPYDDGSVWVDVDRDVSISIQADDTLRVHHRLGFTASGPTVEALRAAVAEQLAAKLGRIAAFAGLTVVK